MQSLFFISLMNGAAWGGSEELWYRTALYAADNGYKVACAAYDWAEKAPRFAELERRGVKVYRLPNKGRKKETFFQKWQYKLVTPAKLAGCVRQLPLEEYDHVVVSQGGFEIVEQPWKLLYRRLKHYTLLFHNYSEQQQFKPRKVHLLQQWIGNASVNLVAAGRIQAVLEERLQIKMPHAKVLRNPITFLPPDTLPSLPSLQSGVVWVMLAALDVDRKAQDNLVKALASQKWKSRNWQLHLYGDGKDRALLQQLIQQQQLENKVVLKGHTTDVKTSLQQAHLLLQITHTDAMPLSVVEAMAMGRPVVSSAVGDMPEWVQEGVNGWVSKNAGVEAIDAVLEKAWAQQHQWDQMGKRSFNLFQEKYPAHPEAYLLQQLKESEVLRHQ